MPELPEVESIKLQLAKFLTGHTIKDVVLHAPRIFEGDIKDIIGGKVTGARRFAKVLSIDLDNGYSIVTHIKLTGQFLYQGKNLPNPKPISKKIVGGAPGKHTRITFELDQNSHLYYNDIRMFGWMKIIKTSEVENTGFVSKLGPEPFGAKNGKPELLTLEKFTAILSKSRRPIKVVIMDQEKMGGVGNIYANDALWLSEIHPERPANSLTEVEQKKLFEAIHTVLKKGLETGGASELAFVTPDGQEGGYQDFTLAYGMQGKDCTRCKKAKFEKYFLGGRGTYICPVCQEINSKKENDKKANVK
jgi:formamidopyrimidine-DNA glycosylase